MSVKPKYYQAVIVIHGIGDQRPMDTVRSFVNAVLPKHGSGPKYFSKPDKMSEIFELRKLQNRQDPRTHFFEYYWAYKVEGTKMSHVVNWIKTLLFRKPKNVPKHLRPLWYTSWVLILTVLAFVALGGFNQATNATGAVSFIISGIGAALLAMIQGIFINSVGDAARYLSPNPKNIALRQSIRAAGIDLLRKLHESGTKYKRKYKRIILVGHSLGSLIAYDIMKHVWQEYCYDYASPELHKQPLLRKTEEFSEKLAKEPDIENLREFRDCQSKLWGELRELGNPWLVTDLITMGSPFAHATLLLAKSEDEFRERCNQRELPRCPPIPEDKGGFSFDLWEPFKKNGQTFKLRAIHSAGLFACTRWTNLYFPVRWGLGGDVLGGPLREWFGPGVLDIPVKSSKWHGWASHTPAAHSLYWWEDKKNHETSKQKGPPSLMELVKTIDIDGKNPKKDKALHSLMALVKALDLYGEHTPVELTEPTD